MSIEQVTLTDLLEHFTKDDLSGLGIKYVTTVCPVDGVQQLRYIGTYCHS